MGQFLRALELIQPAHWLIVVDLLNQDSLLTKLTPRRNTLAGVLGSSRYSKLHCETIAAKRALRAELSVPLGNALRIQAERRKAASGKFMTPDLVDYSGRLPLRRGSRLFQARLLFALEN